MPRGVFERSRTTCRKISLQKKRWWRKHPGYRKKLSQAMLTLWKTREFRRLQAKLASERLLESWKDPDYRDKMSEIVARTNRHRPKEIQAERFSKRVKEFWKDPVKAKKMAANHKLLSVISRPQISLLKRLCRRGISGFRLNYQVDRWLLDVANPDWELVVEVDGAYWHSNPTTRRKDRRRNRYLRRRGWSVWHIGTSRDDATRVIERILQWSQS